MALHLVEDLLAGDPQQLRVVLRGLGHEVVERWMARREMERVHASSQGLDALPFSRRQRSTRYARRGFSPVLVPYGDSQSFQILLIVLILDKTLGDIGRGQGVQSFLLYDTVELVEGGRLKCRSSTRRPGSGQGSALGRGA